MRKTPLNLFLVIVLVLSFSAIAFACFEVFVFNNEVVSLKEGGVVESMQVLVLGIVTLIYGFCALKNKGDERWISLFFTAVFYLLILRALGFKDMEVPDSVKYIFSGTGRTISVSIVIAIAIIGALINYKHYIIKTVSLLFSKRGALLFSSFVVLQIAQWLEDVDFPYNVLCEEGLELVGYCMLLAPAYFTKNMLSYKDGIPESHY